MKNNQTISTSITISGPGTYGVLTTGITITLPNWTFWKTLGSVIIKDLTGAGNPNITVQAFPGGGGLIDNAASTVLTNAFESVTFDPFLNGNTWTQA